MINLRYICSLLSSPTLCRGYTFHFTRVAVLQYRTIIITHTSNITLHVLLWAVAWTTSFTAEMRPSEAVVVCPRIFPPPPLPFPVRSTSASIQQVPLTKSDASCGDGCFSNTPLQGYWSCLGRTEFSFTSDTTFRTLTDGNALLRYHSLSKLVTRKRYKTCGFRGGDNFITAF